MSIARYLQSLKRSGSVRNIPNISEENATFLQQIIREYARTRILEIGTANGYSTLQLANSFGDIEQMPDITTIEFVGNMHLEAIHHFETCGAKKITAIHGDASAVIPKLCDGYFDFCFIDARKSKYLDYLLDVLPKLADDAIICFDDVVKFRSKMENLYTFLDTKKIPYHIEMTDPDDGLMILEKRNLPRR